MSILEKITENLENRKERSAWGRGVNAYALELVEGLEEAYNGGYISEDDLRDARRRTSAE